MPERLAQNPWLYRSFAIIAVVVVVVVGWLCLINWRTTVILVRHAEKGAGSNPDLTAEGFARAQDLVVAASEGGVSRIYATEWCRTALTAKPLAEALGLTILVQQSSHPDSGLGGCSPAIPATLYSLLPPAIDTSQELADEIASAGRGRVTLVVGHSNTVPELIDHLGSGSFDPIVIGNAFDRLFVVDLRDFFVAPRLLKGRYGEPSCADGSQATCPP